MFLSFRDKSRAESSDQSYDTKEGHYEGYRDSYLPEGYTAYGQNGNADEVYDRYEYDQGESQSGKSPKRSLCKQLKSFCCNMGKQKQNCTVIK